MVDTSFPVSQLVIVDGGPYEPVLLGAQPVHCVEEGRIPGLDEEALSAEANRVNQAWKERSGTVYPQSYEEWEGP